MLENLKIKTIASIVFGILFLSVLGIQQVESSDSTHDIRMMTIDKVKTQFNDAKKPQMTYPTDSLYTLKMITVNQLKSMIEDSEEKQTVKFLKK